MQKSDFPEAWNDEFRPAVTKLRCPRCRSKSIDLTEYVEASTTFTVVDGKLNRSQGMHDLGNFTGRMTGHCRSCHHGWTLKGAGNIDMVAVELHPTTFEPLYPEDDA